MNYDIHIWVDAEEGYETHIYIKCSNESKVNHYYHWDSLLLWEFDNIKMAKKVIIK